MAHPGLEKLDRFLDAHSHIVITTHESPDADGLGAEIAFLELLRHLGKNTMILNGDPTPEKYFFMDVDNDITWLSDRSAVPEDIDKYALIILDTNEFSNTGNTYRFLHEYIDHVFVVDHHEGEEFKLASNYVAVDASSASEIMYGIFKHYKLRPSEKAARALYAGILFDTGGFRYSRTTPTTFRTIADLVECGANPTHLYEQIYENNQLSNFLLRVRMLSTIEVHHQGRMLLMHLTPEMIQETGGSFAEGELNISLPLTVKGVQASVVLKQDVDGPLKVSMRTKGDINVSDIAIAHNGGGHKNAAGYKSNLSREETYTQVLADLAPFFSEKTQ